VLGRFTWHATAAGTAEHYQLTIEDHKRRPGRPARLTAEEFVGFGGSAPQHIDRSRPGSEGPDSPVHIDQVSPC
jgi:hypothetical protein